MIILSGTSVYQSEFDCFPARNNPGLDHCGAWCTNNCNQGWCGIQIVYAGNPRQHNVLYNVWHAFTFWNYVTRLYLVMKCELHNILIFMKGTYETTNEN